MDYPKTRIDGMRHRGHHVTRLETFVDAAFAFALTMLVISVGTVPHSLDEFFGELWHIPNFVACFALISVFWIGHNRFSRQFGIDDATTTFYSLLLVLLVLIFVYPLRIVIGLGLWFVTGGFLPTELALPEQGLTLQQLEGVFIIYGVGYTCLCAILWQLNRHALGLADQLQLTPLEKLEARIAMQAASINFFIGLVSIAIASLILFLHVHNALMAGAPGFAYALLGICMPLHSAWAKKARTRTAST